MAAIAHSYADPVTGCVHLRLRGEDREFRKFVELARADPRGGPYKSGLYEYAWESYRELLIHEWAHVFQLATYPYVLLRSARAGRMMAGPATYLASKPGRYPLPLQFGVDEAWDASNILDTVPFKVTVHSTGFEFRAALGESVARGILTDRDLLEEDATVMQYRAAVNGPGSGDEYRRWLREAPHYTRLFTFLAAQLEDADAALRLLPILVRLAYRTTRPLEALLSSLATLKHEGLWLSEDKEDDQWLEEILLSNLRSRMGTVDIGELQMGSPELDDPCGVIDDGAMAAFAAEFVQMPITLLTQLDLGATDSRRGVAREVLREPWRFFGGQGIDDRLYDYYPPAFTIALDDPSFPIGSSLLAISSLLGDTPFAAIPGQTYADWMAALVKGRVASQSLRQGKAGPNPRCPHESCPYHPTGLCHDWLTIPASAAACEFPEHFTLTTNHRPSPDGSMIEPVQAG